MEEGSKQRKGEGLHTCTCRTPQVDSAPSDDHNESLGFRPFTSHVHDSESQPTPSPSWGSIGFQQ